ncbi:MAG: pantoate--beta-alanine ligase [Verrucomicrobia bacterium]|nr:pantoate--beta-alanine ligase [Verrucomicrobiota bacterium]MBV9130837.1 pantoate--beta-alanine ligase [Verrucomicrobiota bacterium]MBV9642468.1 pantoate--beta-alanine ligase [Verrucomicrobiota bacterium]
MRIVESIARMQQLTRSLPRPVVLVPTMGALHEGHLALVDHAKKLVGRKGSTVVTIFVNPPQFGPREDYRKYPRPFKRDCLLLQNRGCDLVFAPTAANMYKPDASVTVMESQLQTVMCGASRPGHFVGVCTVVTKLFHLVQPDIAIFGEKDFQQLTILRRMVRDLNFPVRIVARPIVREPDGLALSSRNVFLSAEERQQAPLIHQALRDAENKLRLQSVSLRALENLIRRRIERASRAKVDYVAVVDPDTLQAKEPRNLPVLLAAAVFFGSTRLIDNVLVK